MNKIIYFLMFMTGFLTSNWGIIGMIPVAWWIFRGEKKTKRSVIYMKRYNLKNKNRRRISKHTTVSLLNSLRLGWL